MDLRLEGERASVLPSGISGSRDDLILETPAVILRPSRQSLRKQSHEMGRDKESQ